MPSSRLPRCPGPERAWQEATRTSDSLKGPGCRLTSPFLEDSASPTLPAANAACSVPGSLSPLGSRRVLNLRQDGSVSLSEEKGLPRGHKATTGVCPSEGRETLSFSDGWGRGLEGHPVQRGLLPVRLQREKPLGRGGDTGSPAEVSLCETEPFLCQGLSSQT